MLPPLDNHDVNHHNDNYNNNPAAAVAVDEDGVDASTKFIVLDPVERSATNVVAGEAENRLVDVADGGEPITSRGYDSSPIGGRQTEFSPTSDAKAQSFHHQKPESALSQLQKNFKNVFKEVIKEWKKMQFANFCSCFPF